MVRRKSGIHVFPNQRALISVLNRVEDDMALADFYKAVATAFAGKPITLDAFAETWQEKADAYLSGEWWEFVHNNVEQYIRVLVWHHNPMYATTLISRYRQWLQDVDLASSAPQSESALADSVQLEPVGGIVVEETEMSMQAPENNSAIYTAEGEDTSEHVVNRAESSQEAISVTFVQTGGVGEESADGGNGDGLSQATYDQLAGDLAGMTVAEMTAFAEMYDVDISGQRLKADIHDAILVELRSRIS